MLVHTWEMTKDLDEKGYYVLVKHVLVEFVIEGISGIELEGFNHQNVLFGLHIEKMNSGFQMNLDASYGLEGSIEFDQVSILLKPGRPADTA